MITLLLCTNVIYLMGSTESTAYISKLELPEKRK